MIFSVHILKFDAFVNVVCNVHNAGDVFGHNYLDLMRNLLSSPTIPRVQKAKSPLLSPSPWVDLVLDIF